MGNYRVLDRWAEREQRRFDHPVVPGAEPTGLRILGASFAVFAMLSKFVTLPLLTIAAVVLIAQHTVRSVALGVGLLVLCSLMAFTGHSTIRRRREQGVNWFTGLAPRAR